MDIPESFIDQDVQITTNIVVNTAQGTGFIAVHGKLMRQTATDVLIVARSEWAMGPAGENCIAKSLIGVCARISPIQRIPPPSRQ